MSSSLAGIVPIAGHKSDIDLPWHHVLMPYDRNKTLIQHAVYNCAMAGCKSIWVICNDDQQPLVRKVVGDSIEDPVYRYRAHARFATEHKKIIPIFYAPLPIRDAQKRSHVAWSAIFGCLLANKIFKQISTYVAPERFFVSWPYAVLTSVSLREHRKQMQKESIVFSDNQLSVHTDDFLPFTCNVDDIEELKQHCYELQNPYVDNEPFHELSVSRILLPLRQLSEVDLGCSYKRAASWEGYCALFK
tara:strand:+ start:3547 stop:4284 length:738 start_codon:yes stop_codon:yes gene_type:complete